jgi:hypothetical protein
MRHRTGSKCQGLLYVVPRLDSDIDNTRLHVVSSRHASKFLACSAAPGRRRVSSYPTSGSSQTSLRSRDRAPDYHQSSPSDLNSVSERVRRPLTLSPTVLTAALGFRNT